MLPGKIRGSAAHAAEQVEKSMCVVARCGMPTYFITLTMNPNWPELKHLCEPGYPPPPTATCRVFKQKLKELFKRLKKWDGGMVYYMYVIEFQHRGLPHIHLAMRTRNDNPDLRAMNADINHEMGGDVKITCRSQNDGTYARALTFDCHLSAASEKDSNTLCATSSCRLPRPFTS